jgi:hypothetical protein
VPQTTVRTLGGSTELAEELVRVGLWERVDRAYLIHDFAVYNRTKAQVIADRQQRIDAGKLGAAARWRPDGGSPSEMHGEIDGGSPSETHGDMDAPYPVPRYPVPAPRLPSPKRVPALSLEKWPDYVPDIVREAWHARGFRLPPTPDQMVAIHDKPATWPIVAELIAAAPARAKANMVMKHVLDGLSAEVATEKAADARQKAAAKAADGRGTGGLTKISAEDVVARLGVGR